MGNPAEKTIRHPNRSHCIKAAEEVKHKNAKNSRSVGVVGARNLFRFDARLGSVGQIGAPSHSAP